MEEQTVSKMDSYQVRTALKNYTKNLSSPHLFYSEVKNGPTAFSRGDGDKLYRFDAVSIAVSWSHPVVTIYEIKISRSDFKRDNKFIAYAKYCNQLYLACPKGMIQKEELPLDCGLVWVDEKGVIAIKKRPPFRTIEADSEFYRYLLFSGFDELNPKKPIGKDRSLAAYEYLSKENPGPTDDRSLGEALSTKMSLRIAELAKQNEEMSKSGGKSYLTIDKIAEILREHSVYVPTIGAWGSLQIDEEKLPGIIEKLFEKGFTESRNLDYAKSCASEIIRNIEDYQKKASDKIHEGKNQ